MHLKLSSFEKGLFQELSTFCGYPVATVREVFEFNFIHQVEEYSTSKKFIIPFLGELKVEYLGDNSIEGVKEANIKTTFLPSSLLLRVIGETEDGSSDLIEKLLEQKIKTAVSNAINEE